MKMKPPREKCRKCDAIFEALTADPIKDPDGGKWAVPAQWKIMRLTTEPKGTRGKPTCPNHVNDPDLEDTDRRTMYDD
jgi:hypothetical protein